MIRATTTQRSSLSKRPLGSVARAAERSGIVAGRLSHRQADITKPGTNSGCSPDDES